MSSELDVCIPCRLLCQLAEEKLSLQLSPDSVLCPEEVNRLLRSAQL